MRPTSIKNKPKCIEIFKNFEKFYFRIKNVYTSIYKNVWDRQIFCLKILLVTGPVLKTSQVQKCKISKRYYERTVKGFFFKFSGRDPNFILSLASLIWLSLKIHSKIRNCDLFCIFSCTIHTCTFYNGYWIVEGEKNWKNYRCLCVSQ